MSEPATFVNQVLRGRAFYSDIDDWVDIWHDADDESPVAKMALHEFLGMSTGEYALWIERPEALRFIIAARKTETSTDTVEMLNQVAAAAARAKDDGEAANVIHWLQQTGRL